MKLNLNDWKGVKSHAEAQIKDGLITVRIWTNITELAEKEIKKLPAEESKEGQRAIPGKEILEKKDFTTLTGKPLSMVAKLK